MSASPRRGPAPLGDALRSFLRSSGLDAQLRDARVYAAWDAALGEALAKRAVPVRFHEGELTVEVTSSVHLQELTNFTGEQYRALANARLGREAIQRVAFKARA